MISVLVHSPDRRASAAAATGSTVRVVNRMSPLGVVFGVHRHDPSLAALALANTDGGPVSVQRQVPRLDRQRLGDPEPGSPLDQKQQSGPGIWSCTCECVDLVGLEVLRELLGDFLIDVATWIGMLAPGATVAIDGCGPLACQSGTSLCEMDGTLPPSDCPNLGRDCRV